MYGKFDVQYIEFVTIKSRFTPRLKWIKNHSISPEKLILISVFQKGDVPISKWVYVAYYAFVYCIW